MTWRILLLAAVSATCLLNPQSALGRQATATPIEHLVVLMQQNRTFDHYFGTYAGADGPAPGTCVPADPADPESVCFEPFHTSFYPDLVHSRTTFWRQFNEGAMDGFVHALELRGQQGRLAMGYLDDRDLPYYWNLADEYVLFDRFFSSAHSGSVQNRMYWVAGVPGSERGRIPREGYGDIPTIFDRLQESGIEWRFYVRHYDPQLNHYTSAKRARLEPQVQWVPLLSFPRFLDDPERFRRIVDLEEYFVDLERRTLPAVSYILALGATEHPPASPTRGQRLVKALLEALMRSDHWERSAFLLTYDDWGGGYDHVPPPQIDPYGYGFRVPALLVSPYAKRGVVDGTELDFTSILKFIEENWGIPPLAERDSRAQSFAGAFDFSRPPRPPRFVAWERRPAGREQPRRDVIYALYAVATALGILILLTPRRAPRAPRSGDRRTGGAPR